MKVNYGVSASLILAGSRSGRGSMDDYYLYNSNTRSHPVEMVGDMSRLSLNFDLSKIPFVHF